MKDLTEKLTRAASWLEGRKWKLEESRSLADAGYEELTLTLNETADACPRDMLAAVVRAIEAAENGVEQTALEAEGAVHDGTWLLKRVDWRREGDGRNPPQDNRLQLYKRYVRVTDKNPAAHVMENNCFWVVTHMFRFNMAAIEAVPAGSSGVTYAIRGASADKETRLWDYVVEKREQLTTSTGVVTVEDDAFKTVYQRGWYGVRTGDKTHTGAAVALWDPAAQPAGTLVTTPFIQKNDNCTIDIIQRRTVYKNVDNAGHSEDKDFFRTATVQEAVAAAELGEAPAASGGVSVEHKSDLDPSGKWRTRVVTEAEERDLDGTEIQEQEDLSETVSVTENRGKGSAAAVGSPAVGTLRSVVNTRSKGGLWVQRITERVAKLWKEHTVRRVWDYFEKVLEKRSSGVAKADLPVIAEAGGGTWSELELKEREHGKWDVTEVKHAEQNVPDAEMVIERQALLDVEETESIGDDPLPDPDLAGEETPPYYGLGAGVTVRTHNSRTKGGKWRRRLRRVTEAAHSISYAASEHWGETAAGVAGTSSTPIISLTGGSGGKSERAESSPLPNGLYRVSKTTVTESNVSKSYDSADDYFSSAEVEEGIADSVEIVAATGKSQRVSASVTPGGKLRYSKTTETGKDAQVWTLVNKTSYGSDLLAWRVMEAVLVKLYANAGLATAQADAAAFIAAHHPFVIITGTMTDTYHYFYYQHQVGFGLHVNKYGKWDGTLTLRAVLTPGMVHTVMASPEE